MQSGIIHFFEPNQEPLTMVVVTVSEGKLRGGEAVTASGFKYHEFLSVPYAKPPVGDLRFKSPQPPESWENERDAIASDVINTSCQLNFTTGELVGSEDCLYLNVYTPKLPSPGTKTLPVMVFIHGGGFIYGSGIIKTELGPDFIVENDVVVVAINYRLGVFGFLSLDIPEAAGNMGLKDQVKALEWVQKNIENFGGDKDNVTIFGISAGSASVEYLVLSPSAKGLFHKAILQSGSSLNDWAINYKYKELTSNFVEKLGYKGDTEDTLAVYQFLLRAPAPLLTATAFQVTETFTAKSIFFGFVPIVEKDLKSDAFITAHPYKLLKEGRFNKVPILRGFCGKEGTLMNMMKPFAVKELLENRNFVNYWSFDLEGDKEKYNTTFCDIYQKTPLDEDSEKFAVDFFGDLHFSAGIWLAAKFQARCGVPTHFYQFVYDGKLNFTKVLFGLMKKGAGHGDDTYYLFTNDDIHVQPDETDILLRQRMTKMWTNFAKTSDPSSPELNMEWPKFTDVSKYYLIIDGETSIASNYEPQRMAVFEEIYEKYEK